MRKLESYENSKSPTSDLPFGNLKNESSAGSNDGTTILAEQMQDVYYSLYQILQLAGVQPNGILENGSNSQQFISALSNITPLIYNSSSTYNKDVLTLYIYNGEINIYKSLVNNNKNGLTDTSSWVLLTKISSAGVFNNVTMASPNLTGTPIAPTAAVGTANNQIATTGFVKNAFKDFIKFTTGNNTNGAVIKPPSGFTMNDLVAFIPAISTIHYSGDVDGNDSTYCQYSIQTDGIHLTSWSSEQRAATYSNWLAIWVKS